ncbi:MAG: hypothetical protein AB7N70_25985 [Dehalococcoidia bacterium]
MTLPARLYVARRHADVGWQSRWLPDLLAGAAAWTAAIILSWPLLHAIDLNTGAGDWSAHAFRVREVIDHGLTSWSHTWAGGMPLWEGYQAAPHLLTAALVAISGLGITQAMVVLTAVLLVVLRAGTYLAARMLGASPVAALIGVLTVCLLDSVRQPAANYSELWGVALAPLLLAASYRWSGRPAGLIVAAVGGVAIEVHPHLAIVSMLGFAAGFVVSRRDRSVAIVLLQAGLTAMGAAVFWLPVLASARPAYIEPYFVSLEFARLLLSLAIGGFLPGWPVIAAATIFVALVTLRRRDDTRAVSFLLLCGLGVVAVVTMSLVPLTPDTIRAAQLTRVAGTAPILIGLLVAVLLTIVLRRVDGQRQVWAAAFALFTLAIAVDRARPLPVTGHVVATSDPAARMIGGLGEQPRGRVLADPVLTAYASYARGGARYAASYSGRDWSIVSGPAQFYLGEYGTPSMRSAYLLALGAEYLVVPSGTRPDIVDPATGTAAEWRLVDTTGGYDLLQTPWQPAMAWHIHGGDRDRFTVPDAGFRDVRSAYLRDVAVERLAGVAARDVSAQADVQYPDGETIVVTATSLNGSRYLVINENWGSSWTAHVNGEPRPVERFGANQIGVDLAGVTGDATVRLHHSWPVAQLAGLFLSLLSLPVAVVLGIAVHRVEAQRRHR